jgi:hypothetical protein
MPLYEFRLILHPLRKDVDFDADLCNQVYEACGEVEFGQLAGVPEVGFIREAETFEDAVRQAIADLRPTGLTVSHVAPPRQAYDAAAAEQINRGLSTI